MAELQAFERAPRLSRPIVQDSREVAWLYYLSTWFAAAQDSAHLLALLENGDSHRAR